MYQSRNDNTVRYSTHLLKKYRASVMEANKQYDQDLGLVISVQGIRESFKGLIEMGYLLPNYSADVFTINPMLVYRTEYIRKDEYRELVQLYQAIQFGTGGDYRDIGKILSGIINRRIKEKKVNK